MDNLKLWESVRKVPEEAKKSIGGGRLKGMTDINPMWRIKTLTEQFGMVGIGWYYQITEKRMTEGANGEIAAFVDIDLFVKINDEWSKPIQGTGGSMFIAKERSGLYTSDECFKMALTDAISVACKSLGIGADVYWDKDRTKYSETPQAAPQAAPQAKTLTPQQLAFFKSAIEHDSDPDQAKERLKELYKSLGASKLSEVKQENFDELKDKFLEYGLPFSLN